MKVHQGTARMVNGRMKNMPLFRKGDPELLAAMTNGTVDAAIVQHGPTAYVATTLTREGPARPDLPAAADLRDMLTKERRK